MTRMTGPDCVVMCNIINTHTHTHIHTHKHTSSSKKYVSQPDMVAVRAGGHLNKENAIFLCPRLRLRVCFRETVSTVLSRASLLILRAQTEYGAKSRDCFNFP